MSSNESMRQFWNGEIGAHWVDLDATLEHTHKAFNAPLLDAAGIGPGDKVIDLGCGTGSLSRDAAARVGPDGHILGIDISKLMIKAAQAHYNGSEQISYVEADAQTYAFEAKPYDHIISRLGAMFFEDPPAAFSNLRRAVRQGGGLHFVTWRDSLDDNPWMAWPKKIALEVLDVEPPKDPFAPGPFALADTDHGMSLLAQGGWERVKADRLTVKLSARGGFPGALTLMTQIGPGAAAIRRGEATPVQIASYRNGIEKWLQNVMTGTDLQMDVVMNLYSAVRND